MRAWLPGTQSHRSYTHLGIKMDTDPSHERKTQTSPARTPSVISVAYRPRLRNAPPHRHQLPQAVRSSDFRPIHPSLDLTTSLHHAFRTSIPAHIPTHIHHDTRHPHAYTTRVYIPTPSIGLPHMTPSLINLRHKMPSYG